MVDNGSVRTKTEVWSRSVGYLRPVEQWNDGKQQEFHDRLVYNVGSINETLAINHQDEGLGGLT
jgi:hypothetical protein